MNNKRPKENLHIVQVIDKEINDLHTLCFYLRDQLKITSALDWAVKDLKSFQTAHIKKQTVAALYNLGLVKRPHVFRSGCSGVCQQWRLEDWLFFCRKNNFTTTTDWRKRSPETIDAASKSKLLVKIKNIIENRESHRQIETQDKTIEFVRTHKGVTWREIGRAIESRIRRTDPDLLKICNEILEEKRNRSTWHAKTDDEILRIIKEHPGFKWKDFDQSLHAFLSSNRPHLLLEGNYILEGKRIAIKKEKIFTIVGIKNDEDLLLYIKNHAETSWEKISLDLYKILQRHDKELLQKCQKILNDKKHLELPWAQKTDLEILEYFYNSPLTSWEKIGSSIHSYIWKYRNHLLAKCSEVLAKKRHRISNLKEIMDEVFYEYFNNNEKPFSVLRNVAPKKYEWLKTRRLLRWCQAYVQIKQGFLISAPEKVEYLYWFSKEELTEFLSLFKIDNQDEAKKLPGFQKFLSNKNYRFF